jgi:hypothetical protein
MRLTGAGWGHRAAATKVCESLRPPAVEADVDAEGNSFSSLWRILAARKPLLLPAVQHQHLAYHSPHHDACP